MITTKTGFVMLRIAKGTNEDVDVDAASREHEVGATEVDSADPASHMEQASGAVAVSVVPPGICMFSVV